MKDNVFQDENDVTPQPVRDLFDRIALKQGTPKHSRFAMCRPDYLSTKIPNNVFMEGKDAEKPDVPRAINQWDRTAHLMEALGVEIFEIPPTKGCQDQCYVANIGLSTPGSIVLANFKAPGRACEVAPAKSFFESLGYNCIRPPFFFEGEADCKKWKEGVYFGGYGLFSSEQAFKWMEKKCGIQIIPVREIDPKTYHLDCSLVVIDEENFIVNKKGLSKDSIKTLEKCGNVIFTPDGVETTGITNGVLIPEKRIYLSGAFNPEQPDYRKAMEWLLEEMDKLHYTCVFVDVDAYNPSGADLSCSVMHLDYPPTSGGQ